jgi:hypothetical protein
VSLQRWLVVGSVVLAAIPLVAVAQAASILGVQASVPVEHDAPPFAAGERLVYAMRNGPKGSSGRGVMWIEDAAPLRDTPVIRLRSEFSVRVAFLRGSDRTDSWFDPTRMAALRFEKHSRHPFSREDESVELYPAERRWVAADSGVGESPTDAPLDELSFIYYVRTLELPDTGTTEVTRHYDVGRNPVTLQMRGRETITTRAGRFETVIVEMRVKDPRRADRDGVVTLYLSDDRFRVPVRIVSRMPVLGTAEFSLESMTRGVAHTPR